VVPLSVLLTPWRPRAAHLGDAGLSAVHVEQPVLLEQARLIQVVADGESLTLASTVDDDAGTARWVRHVTAQRCTALPAAQTTSATDHVAASPPRSRPSSSWWPPGAWRASPTSGPSTGWHSRPTKSPPAFSLDEATIVGLLDAAVHVARLADRANRNLLVPADAESLWLIDEFSDRSGAAVARRRSGQPGELIVDITVTDADGNLCGDLRGLRFADVEATPSRPRAADPADIAQSIQWQPWVAPADRIEPGGVAVLAELAHNAIGCTTVWPGSAARLPSRPPPPRHLPRRRSGSRHRSRCRVYVSTAVGDVVRQLADATPGIRPRYGWSPRACTTPPVTPRCGRAACGDCRSHRGRATQIWGGLLDIAAGDDVDDDVLPTLLSPSGVTTLVRRDGQFLAPAWRRCPALPCGRRPAAAPTRPI